MATLPGLDGRKMSKSYDNTIPLFAPREQLKKLIAGIVTDSRAPGEPKDADNSNVFQLYQAFASAAGNRGDAPGLRRRHRLGRSQAAPVRAHRCWKSRRCASKYEALIARPAEIEAMLRDGAQRLRAQHATPLLVRLREAVGLRDLSRTVATEGAKKGEDRRRRRSSSIARATAGSTSSSSMASACWCRASASRRRKDAGQLIARLKQEGGAALRHVEAAAVHLGDELVGHLHDATELAEVVEALAQFAEDA